MEDRKSKIPITIAGKDYLFTVEESRIELFKLAERRVNNAILNFEKRNMAEYSKQDAVALVALDFAISNIKLRQQGAVESNELAALKEIEERIENYLLMNE